jgi:hypothetical protein
MMSDLDKALWHRITQIVQVENRPFSFVDFVPTFDIDGKIHSIAYGTLRNKIAAMSKATKIRCLYQSHQAFYTINEKSMTIDHTAVPAFPAQGNNCRRFTNDPVYRIIQNMPFGKRALHDVRLRFEVIGIWRSLSSGYKPNPRSHDIQLSASSWKIKNLDISVTVHVTDTVSVVLGCSYCPIAVDLYGVIRVSSALAVVHERLCNMIFRSKVSGCASSDVPDPSTWIVTLWHFGRDSITTFSGDKFNISWEIAEHALVNAYCKEWKQGKTRVRIEKQEYPRKSLAEALEEKLNANCRFESVE